MTDVYLTNVAVFLRHYADRLTTLARDIEQTAVGSSRLDAYRSYASELVEIAHALTQRAQTDPRCILPTLRSSRP